MILLEDLERSIERCELASQLEIEFDCPITYKTLLPILKELQSLRIRNRYLEEKLEREQVV